MVAKTSLIKTDTLEFGAEQVLAVAPPELSELALSIIDATELAFVTALAEPGIGTEVVLLPDGAGALSITFVDASLGGLAIGGAFSFGLALNEFGPVDPVFGPVLTSGAFNAAVDVSAAAEDSAFAVPTPAALPLLLSAFGALIWIRRRAI